MGSLRSSIGIGRAEGHATTLGEYVRLHAPDIGVGDVAACIRQLIVRCDAALGDCIMDVGALSPNALTGVIDEIFRVNASIDCILGLCPGEPLLQQALEAKGRNAYRLSDMRRRVHEYASLDESLRNMFPPDWF